MRIRPSLALLLLVTMIAVLALVAGAGASTAGAGAVYGHISDAVSGAPLPYAYVHFYTADGTHYGYTYADGNGDYVIALSESVWKLRFSAGFHVTEFWNDKPDVESADLLIVPGAPLMGIDAALARGPQAHLKGKVVDGTSGEPIQGASVQALPLAGGVSGPYVLTASDGTYDLTVAPGAYTLYYSHYSHDPVYYPHSGSAEGATPLTVEDGDELTGMDETLPVKQIRVTGLAQDVEGGRIEGVELQLVDPVDGHVLRSATTDFEGYCAIDVTDMVGISFKERFHDPAGEYADLYNNYFAYGTTSFSEAATVTVTPGGMYSCALRLFSANMGEIKGRTLNALGEPVPYVPIWVTGGVNHSVETVSDANGDYDVSGLRVAASGTDFTVYFNANGALTEYLACYYRDAQTRDAASKVHVDPGQAVTADAGLYSKGKITGTVVDANGPLAGIEVTLYRDGIALDEETTYAAGAYSFGGLWPGSYTLGYRDPSVADPTALPGYKDAYYGGAMYLPDAALITFDGLTTRTVTADAATLEPWGGVKVDAQCDLEPYLGIDGLSVTLYDADKQAVRTTNRRDGNAYLFKCLPLGTYYVGVSDGRGVYTGEVFDDVTSLDEATPIVLTTAASKAEPVVRLTPVRGVSPDFGALPDGSTATASLRLGIYPQAIASSGDTTLICGQGSGSQNGCFAFQRGDAGWALRQLLTFPSGRGWAVDVDGDLAAVCGVDGSDSNPGKNGKLHVFRRAGGVWELETTLQPEPNELSQGFALSVAVSGETILVGAPSAMAGPFRTAGAVYVYVHGASGWTQEARLTADQAAYDRHFGAHVALDGDRAIIGTGADVGGTASVYERAAGSWRTTGQLLVPQGISGVPQYGAALALEGDTALVGAPGQDLQTGAVYVFTGSGGDGGWTLSATLTAADGQPNDCFGRAVDLRDGDALVGAPTRGTAAYQYPDGGAYLFRHEGDSWRQDAEMLPVPGVAAAYFGTSVAIAGRDLFVGSPRETRVDGTAGRVHVFSPYVTDAGVQLLADAGHGVLVNDIGPEGYALTAELVTGPSHGLVQLGSDGSFLYTPEAGFAGADQFTYRDVSGDWQSDPTTVDITVRGTTAPTLSVQGAPAGWVNAQPTVSLAASAAVGLAAIEYRAPDAEVWSEYDAPISVTAEGASFFAARSRDVFGNASRGGFTVRLDTRRPTPRAPSAATVRRGRTCTLRYSVADAAPGSPTATVKIVVRDSRGRQRWTGRLFGKLVNKPLACTFRCRLPVGTYRFSVYATDAAGNPQTKVASNRLRVR